MPAPSSSPIRPVLTHLAAAADTGRFAGTGVVAALAIGRGLHSLYVCFSDNVLVSLPPHLLRLLPDERDG